MKGNPHAEAVNTGIQNIRDMIGRREMYHRDGLGIILEAQSRLTVAHEVRTLSLVSLLASVPMSDEDYADMLREVQKGLGRS